MSYMRNFFKGKVLLTTLKPVFNYHGTIEASDDGFVYIKDIKHGIMAVPINNIEKIRGDDE